MDEPTDGLDPNQKHEVRQRIRKMGETKAIIFSTHILEEVDAATMNVAFWLHIQLLVTRTRSRPGGKNFLRHRNLFHRTAEVEFVFSGPASDMDLDGFQAAVLHSQAKLFIDFLNAVLLEAFAHD